MREYNGVEKGYIAFSSPHKTMLTLLQAIFFFFFFFFVGTSVGAVFELVIAYHLHKSLFLQCHWFLSPV